MTARLGRTWLLLGAFVLACGCGTDPVEEAPLKRPVRQHIVTAASGDHVRTFSGTAQTRQAIDLSFRAGGVITHLEAKLGQEAKTGQVLARLDNVSARLSYEQAVSSLNSAASQMETAKLALDRTAALYEVGNVALSELESARNSFRTARASHESAQRSVEIQKDQLGYGRIVAPADGTIAEVSAELNENVSAGQVVAVLNVGSEMEIALGLPENVVHRVVPNMEVTVAFPSLAEVPLAGRVSEVSPSIESSSATYPVRVAIEEPGASVRAGMAATVTFELGTESAADQHLVVPASAVGEDGGGRFVLLLEPQEDEHVSVQKRYVEVGSLTSEGFLIHDGLVAGQAVASAGLQTLLDGQSVRVLE